jgi:bifunctional non-homologous end joining protein LigD
MSARARAERRTPRARSGAVVAGVTVTHPDRVLFPAAGLTKLDLVRYYDAVADWILPHLAGRPLTLKQCAPDAEHCRYLRHSSERPVPGVRVVKIQELTKIGDYMIVDDRPGLVALAQRNIVEFHTWSSRDGSIERPDRIVFDFDPGPRVPWPAVVDAAKMARRGLAALGLDSWVKTTGGRGLHVVVPIVPRDEWAACLEFARQVAGTWAAADPGRYTVTYAKRGRESKILIDYLRNNRTNTIVAAYSVRARPFATVSMPVSWDQLTPRLDPSSWTMATTPRRLERRADPWDGYSRSRQTMPPVSRPRRGR